MAKAARVTVVVEPAAIERARRLFDTLTGVPISPDRKEAMFRAAIMDGARINGRPVPLARAEEV